MEAVPLEVVVVSLLWYMSVAFVISVVINFIHPDASFERLLAFNIMIELVPFWMELRKYQALTAGA